MQKILLTILVFFLLLGSNLSLFSASIHAQSSPQATAPPQATSPWYSQNPFEWYIKVYDESMSPPNEIFGERYTAAQVQWVVWSLITTPVRLVETVVDEKTILCVFKRIGTNTVDVSDCLQGFINTIVKILDFIIPSIQASNDRPVLALVFDSTRRGISGIEYTKSLINKFSPVTEVHAQGYGYTGLSWLQKYWRGFRDMSYFLLVLVVIVFAFMIMFRVKISPQLVISIQSALPKVIIALILITFSYAIAGFAIDLMYVISGIFTILLKLAGFAEASSNSSWALISGEGLGFQIAGGFWIFFVMLGYSVLFFVFAFWATIATIVGGLSVFGAVVGIIFMLIAVWCLILMLWYTLKIPYVLLKTLISFYVSVITAPIQILAGTISPTMGFGMWFKKVMADILVFPVTGLLIWFAFSFLFASGGQAFLDVARGLIIDESTLWAPGMIGSAADMGGIIFLAISFSIITLIPKVPGLLKSIIMGEKLTSGSALGTVGTVGLIGGSLTESYAQKKAAALLDQSEKTADADEAAALVKRAGRWSKVQSVAQTAQNVSKNIH